MVSLGHNKLIHGPKHRKDNQSQILKPPAEYFNYVVNKDKQSQNLKS